VTSAEKVARARAVLATAIAEQTGSELAVLVGVWRFLPAFLRRRVVDALPVTAEQLEDEEFLDELLGLIAGVALELHSDGVGPDYDEQEWHVCRVNARELLARLGVAL
jgi:hypothetical protein